MGTSGFCAFLLAAALAIPAAVCAPVAAESIGELSQLLRSEDADLRRYSARMLVELGPAVRPAQPALEAALEDPDKVVQSRVVAALAALGPSADAPLRRALLSADFHLSAAAAKALAARGEASLEMFAEALDHANPLVREAAAQGLGAIGEPALYLLTEALEDEDANVVEAAISSLGDVGEPALPILRSLLNDCEVDWQAGALCNAVIRGLGRVGPAALPLLAELLRSDNFFFQRWASGSLARLGPLAVPVLNDALESEDPEVQYLATETLAEIGPPALDALLIANRDENPRVRRSALPGLLEAGPRGLEALQGALRDPDPSVRVRALLALAGDSSGPVEATVIASALTDEAPEVRAAGFDILTFSELESTAELAQALIDVSRADEEHRLRIVQALSEGLRYDPGLLEQVERLETALSSRDVERLSVILGDLLREVRWRGLHSIKPAAGPREEAFEPTKSDRVVVPVYFATDRQLTGDVEPTRYFGTESSDELSFGVARVSLPPYHRRGMLESPTWWDWLTLRFAPDPDKHVALISTGLLSRDEFVDAVSGLLKNVPEVDDRDIVLFIHGYRVTFEDAARRAAQLVYDLNFQGIPAMYSWPSKGRFAAYPADEASSDRTGPHLEQLLTLLATETGAHDVHVVAHSLGGRAVLNALRELEGIGDADGRPVFKHIVLAAPDVDAQVFVDSFKHIRVPSDRATLYASSEDVALKASRKIHQYPRAGEAGDNLLLIDGLDTIDASGVRTDFLNHSVYAEHHSIVTDLFELLRHDLPPSERAFLRPRNWDGNRYWVVAR